MIMRVLLTVFSLCLITACGPAPQSTVSGQSSQTVDETTPQQTEPGCCCSYAVDAVSFAECPNQGGLTRIEHASAEEAESICIENACS